MAFEARAKGWAQVLLALGLLLVAVVLGCRGAQAQEQPEHPAIEAKDFKTETCITCHPDKKKEKVVHPALEAGCETCHTGQKAESGFTISLVAQGNELCFTCHSDKQSDPAKALSTHWPVLKGKCVDCHNPHSSPNEHLLLKPTEGKTAKENLCLTCHKDIAALLASKHPHPAAEMGCSTCHVTHKTGDAKQQEFRFHLTKGAPQLCLDCHDVSGKEILQAHQGQPFEKANCADCHNPHGSDRPKLINTYAHMPFEQKMCDSCHAAPQGGKVVVNEGGKRTLCYTCHDDIKTQIEKAKVPHGLFAKRDFCIDCHSPHAAAYPHQLRRPTVALCETCHVERRQEQATMKFLHPPVFEVGCTVCHDPHASDNPKRLRASINDLCLACHGQKSPIPAKDGKITLFGNVQVPANLFSGIRKISVSGSALRGHPLAGHPISGPNPLQPGKPVITCVTCHNPHASDFTKRRFQLKPGSKSICLNCHG